MQLTGTNVPAFALLRTVERCHPRIPVSYTHLFDVVTAFETVYFWPELAQNFREVYRVLKPGGIFFICNEANGETTKDDKWTQIIGGMTIYTDTALKEYLEKACLLYTSRCV